MQGNDKAKKIGFLVIDYTALGGVERVTSDLISEFKGKSFNELYLISLLDQNKIAQISYPELPKVKVLGKSKKISNQLSAYLLAKKIRYLIFQADNMSIAFEVLKAAKMAGCKAYPQYHGSPFAYLKKYPDALKNNWYKRLWANMIYPFKKAKLKRFISVSPQGVFCVSEGAATELKNLFSNLKGVKSKIKVVRNPIFNHTINTEEKKNRITFVSRLESKHKNAFLVLKAWEMIASKYSDWTLVILGVGSLEESMKYFCKKQEISNVEFKGFVSNVSEELAKSKISLNVSNCEGFSMAIAEAIAQRNAMVITESDGGAKDMVIHEETGLVSPKNKAEALAQNIERLILDELLRDSLSRRAYERLKGMATVSPVEHWLKLFQE